MTEPKPSIKNEMSESCATSSTRSAECSTPEPEKWRTDSNHLLNESSSWKDERFNEQPPSLEPITETSSDPEEIALVAMELDARPFNDHQKKKFSRLRKRVWEHDKKLRELRYDVSTIHLRYDQRSIDALAKRVDDFERDDTYIIVLSYLSLMLSLVNAVYLCTH